MAFDDAQSELARDTDPDERQEWLDAFQSAAKAGGPLTRGVQL
jgi:hypothetical protein